MSRGVQRADSIPGNFGNRVYEIPNIKGSYIFVKDGAPIYRR